MKFYELIIMAALLIATLISCNTGKYDAMIPNHNLDTVAYDKFSKDDFCGIGDTSMIIGMKMKIWHEGGVYTSIGDSRIDYFGNIELQRKARKSQWEDGFLAKAGMVGVVLAVSKFNPGNARSGYRILLLDIDGNIVAIGCGYIVEGNEMDHLEESIYYERQEEIKKIEYSNGCVFRFRNFNDCFNGAGLTKLDSISENFACQLAEIGIDTVLLVKNIFDNGRRNNETAFVAWPLNDQVIQINRYKYDSDGSMVEIRDTIEYCNIFNSLAINQEKPPSSISVSHSIGYVVTLKVGKDYFCDRFRMFDIQYADNQNHPKITYWKLINEIGK